MMFTAFRPRRTAAPAPTKSDRTAARMNTHELRLWGVQVSLYLAQKIEKPAPNAEDDAGERAEALEALQAVHRELCQRGA